MRGKTWVVVTLVVLAAFHGGCSTTPEQRAATERAWADREEERRAECARQGLRYFGGSCLSNAF